VSSKTLKASVLIGGTVSSAFRTALGTTKDGLKQIGEAIANVDRRQRLLANSINVFGRQGKNVEKLRQEYAQLAVQSDRLRRTQERLRRVQSAIDANDAKRAALRGQIFDTVAAAAVVGAPTRAAVQFETAMLGVAKQVAGARDESGKLTRVYFDMARQIKSLGHEVPMATNDIAKMVEAAARMGVAADQALSPGERQKQLIDFTRTAAMMATAFEEPADELAERMAKIAQLYKIPIPAIGGLADAINFLDDSTVAKGGEIIDFLTRTGGVAAAVKVTGNEMAAMGATLLSLGERAETASTATNALFTKLAAADKGTKKFRNAMKEVGLSTSAIQAGMQRDAAGTVLKVLDAVNRLPKEKRMGVLADLVGLEHSDTLAKLAGQTDEFRKQMAMANSEAAKGSMGREFQARLQSTSAQWQIMKNRATELAVNIGEALLPAINDLMKDVGPVVSKFADWAREHPGLVKAIVGTAAALTGMRVATLAASFAITAIKGPALSAGSLLLNTYAAAQVRVAAASTTARTAIMAQTVAIRAQGLAATTTAGALAAMAKRALAVLAVANVADYAAGQFGTGQNKADQAQDDANWERMGALRKVWSGGLRGIEHVGRAIGMTNIADQAQADRVKYETEALGKLPALPERGGKPNVTTTVTQHNTFNITQQPGESPEEFAKRVIAEQKRQEGVQHRGRLTDEVE